MNPELYIHISLRTTSASLLPWSSSHPFALSLSFEHHLLKRGLQLGSEVLLTVAGKRARVTVYREERKEWVKEQRKEILMTGRPPAHWKQKSAQMKRCGQRYGTVCAEGEERAKGDGWGAGGAGNTGVNLCLTISGEEKVHREGTTQWEERKEGAGNE